MTDFKNSTIAVTGAGGHLGQRTVELLLERGATRVIALTRDPAKLAHFSQRGVEVRRASFDEAASLPEALAGVERLLLISTDSVGVAGARAAQHHRAIDAAEAAGVKHIAYTGLTSPYPDSGSPVADSHYWTEARLATSSLDWSFLRNNQYTDYLVPSAQHAIATGTFYHASGTGRRAYVTREDCAAAAAGALLGATGRRVYDISGPEALSVDDLARLFSELAGKPVAAVDVPPAGLKAGLVQGGVPAVMADLLVRFDTDAAKGYLGIVTDSVAELAGRPAQSVAEFFAANRQALAA